MFESNGVNGSQRFPGAVGTGSVPVGCNLEHIGETKGCPNRCRARAILPV